MLALTVTGLLYLTGHEPGVQIQAKTPRPKNGKRNADRASVKRKSEALNAVPLQPKSIVITAPNGLVATASWKGKSSIHNKVDKKKHSCPCSR